jgi:hypothetical protein
MHKLMSVGCALVLVLGMGTVYTAPAWASGGAEDVVISGLLPSDASVEPDSLEALRARYRLVAVPSDVRLTVRAAGLPSLSIASPSAFGADWGEAFAMVGYQDRMRYSSRYDGTASVGIGLGDAHRFVAAEIVLTSYDTATDFFDTRGVSVKIHRRLTTNTSLAVGYENLFYTPTIDGGRNLYVVGSTLLTLRDGGTRWFRQLVLTLGLGNSRFQREDDFLAGTDGMGAFGAVALQAHDQVSTIADWTGQDLVLGLSIAPLRRLPLVITPAVADVTGRAGDGARFVIGAGVAYSFR